MDPRLDDDLFTASVLFLCFVIAGILIIISILK